MLRKSFIFVFIVFLLLLISCSRNPSPRGVVMNFVEAVYQSDDDLIRQYVDLEKFAQENLKEFPGEQKKGLIPKVKEEILKNLVGDGAVRVKWTQRRIVVGNEYINGNEAEVEITYMNPEGRSEFEKVKLHKVEGKWKIYYFKG